MRQLVGNDMLDVLKHWSALSLELSNQTGPFAPSAPTAKISSEIPAGKDKSETQKFAGLAVPRLATLNAAESFATIPISVGKVNGSDAPGLNPRQLLLDTDRDPAEEDSLFYGWSSIVDTNTFTLILGVIRKRKKKSRSWGRRVNRVRMSLMRCGDGGSLRCSLRASINGISITWIKEDCRR